MMMMRPRGATLCSVRIVVTSDLMRFSVALRAVDLVAAASREGREHALHSQSGEILGRRTPHGAAAATTL
jgi:hypothetical protein